MAIVKFVCSFAALAVTKWILEYSRYADNILHSTETVEEYQELKDDLVNSFQTFSMPLKYCVISVKHDPKVLDDPVRESMPQEKMLGIIWDLESDTIVAQPRDNLFGTS